MLYEYEKEITLQIRKMWNEMDDLDTEDCAANYETAQRGARIAHEHMFSSRYNIISNGQLTLLFSNMGPTNMEECDMVRQSVEDADIEVFATAVWPRSQSEEPYTWAMLIGDDDGQRWRDEMWRLHWSRVNFGA